MRSKRVAREHGHGASDGNGNTLAFSRNSSLNSLSTSADDQVNTHLSASSTGATLSSEGSAQTAYTAMSDDEMPHTMSPNAPHAHPAVTVLELTSNTASSSALPDTFGFNISRQGSFISLYTAANIWLIKTAQLPRLWARTLEVKRKPVAVDILEDGSLLAVLSRPSQVDLYEIQGEQDRSIKKRRTIMLVHEASSMALSPDGLILITGNNYGIEVVSIGPNAPESSRRTLSGPVGESLQFSDDGRTLLITGCARRSGGSSLFVLPGLYDGPLNEEGVPIPTPPDAAWTGLVLFPDTIRIARQATLLPDAETGHIDELFAFNAEEDTWGIYDIPTQRFTKKKMFLPDQQRWTRAEFLDDAMPAVSPNADLAAVALRMRGTTSIWIYQVPGWDYKPKSPTLDPIQPCFCIPVLHQSADINQEITALRWVRVDANVQRLVAVGNITTLTSENDRPSVPEGSKAVIIALDFDRTKPAGGGAPETTKTEYDLDPLLPGEKLPEGSIDFEREVELVRTRTLAQRRAEDRVADGRRSSRLGSTPGRAHTSAHRDRPTSIRPSVPTIVRNDSDELTMEEAQAAFEEPYDNTQPRSQNSLARAATVAAVSPANRRHLRALPFRPLEYRRADGLREFPHESDADNWVPPPPAYTVTAEASQSVSLSHPTAPPVPRRPHPGSMGSIPAVPPLPVGVVPPQLLSTGPYQHRGSFQSISSTDLTVEPRPRRPSLVHPSTFPSPQSPGHIRRRSSAAPTHDPPSAPILPRERSAYQTSSTYYATPRPSVPQRRRIESTVELRPPPLVDPATIRRGSAPDAALRPQPAPIVPPHQGPGAYHTHPRRPQSGRMMLPRLATNQAPPTTGPLSAPPRSHTRHAREASRPDTRTTTREKSALKKIGCVLM